MKSLLRVVLSLAALAAAAAAYGVPVVRDPVELMVEDSAAPWSDHEGQGYANDLVRAAYAAVHAELTLRVVPYARCKQYAMHGKTAGCFSMSDAPELHGVVVFSDQPLFQVTPRFYTNPAHPLRAASERDFASGTRIGIVNGYEYPASVSVLAARGVLLDAANTESSNLKKLAVGRVDAALIMTDQIKTDSMMLKEAGAENMVFLFALAPMGSYLGFSVQHPDGERARKLFNEGYRIITANGVKRAIDRKWRLH